MMKRVQRLLPDQNFICQGDISEKLQSAKDEIDRENHEEIQRLRLLI